MKSIFRKAVGLVISVAITAGPDGFVAAAHAAEVRATEIPASVNVPVDPMASPTILPVSLNVGVPTSALDAAVPLPSIQPGISPEAIANPPTLAAVAPIQESASVRLAVDQSGVPTTSSSQSKVPSPRQQLEQAADPKIPLERIVDNVAPRQSEEVSGPEPVNMEPEAPPPSGPNGLKPAPSPKKGVLGKISRWASVPATGGAVWLAQATHLLSSPQAAAWGYLTVGSLIGSFGRYFLAGRTVNIDGTSWPYGTFAVNMAGSFLIGFFEALVSKYHLLGANGKVFLMTALCGGLTTFSSLILESSHLFGEGKTVPALVNLVASVALGLALFRAGEMMGRAL